MSVFFLRILFFATDEFFDYFHDKQRKRLKENADGILTQVFKAISVADGI